MEQGTTFGLTKMLYESVGGHGRIIGLRQRQHSSALACIITQDQTVLIEREYDIILHETSKETSLDKKSPTYHDKNANTYISLKPDAQVWQANSYSTRRQTILGKDGGNIGNNEETTANDGHLWSEQRYTQRNSNEGSAASTIDPTKKQQRIVPFTNCFKYITKEMRIDCPDKRSDDIRVVPPADSTSPSNGSIQSPGGSSQNSPKQVEQSWPQKRKWQCFYCKKFFVCRSAYNNHERTHRGERPFQCNVCGRCFSHQGNLKQHLHIHRDVKPHVCDVCGRGFVHSNRLRDHKRSHQYELFMHTQVQWCAANVTTESPANPVTPNALEKYARSDDNQE